MSPSLKEAEVAAYTDPSQENLAVYVKLLEGDPGRIEELELGLSEVREELERADRRIAELEDELDTLQGGDE